MLLRRGPTALERLFGHRFRRRELLDMALTHRSHTHESGTEGNYERLEFLGDAVLGMLTAEWLYGERPDLPEGELSKLKSYLVSREVLAQRAEVLGLGDALRLGVGEERSGGRRKASLLADVMESVIGAVYLDGGLEAARKVVRPLLEEGLALRERTKVDPKTRLQELSQARGWDLPEYRLAEESGPDHAKLFTVECRLRGRLAGTGSGRSKKVAEQAAAAAALSSVAARDAGAGAPARPLAPPPGAS
ncbi:MAG TPA: ribonuclease III [Thermoanaerobaculia bacterium]|nr:ribonuclease III [Thermoanaerobaculia bacterium]